LELCVFCVRMRHYKKNAWIYVDFVILLGQVVHEIAASASELWQRTRLLHSVVHEITYLLRVIGVLRLFRRLSSSAFRSVLRDLHVMTISVANSLQSLVSALLLMMIIIYALGCYLTESVTRFKIGAKPDDSTRLDFYFGSVVRSMLSLFQSIAGGVSWIELSTPLQAHLSPMPCFFMFLYVAFSFLALLNVISAVLWAQLSVMLKRIKSACRQIL